MTASHYTARRLLPLLVLAIASLPAGAASSTSSAASQGVSASVGSLSTSLEHSSRSSAPDDRVSDGDYTVIEVAEAADRPGLLRLTLQRDGQAWFLYLPPETVQQGGLAAGEAVTARRRPFGIEFAAGQPQRPFFLAVHDAWLPELQTRAIGL